MTVTTTTTENSSLGNGATTAFTFTFRCDDADWVKVYLDDVLQAAGFVTTLNADQGASPGGTVTFTVAPGSGVVVLRRREVPVTQLAAYTAYDSFPAETHELALDKAIMVAQDEVRNRDAAIAVEVADRVAAVAAEAALRAAETAAREAADIAEAALRSGADTAEASARAAADALIIASGAAPANVGIAPVTATGTTQPVSVADRAAREVWLEDFGNAGAGDWTTAVNAALEFLRAAGGGTLRLGRRIYRCDGKVILPTDGAGSRPYTGAIKIVGAGALTNGSNFSWPASVPGSVLDLRYTGDAYGRFWAAGAGSLEVTGVTFAYLGVGATTTPFLLLNGPTPHVHHCAFWDSTGSMSIDAVVLGGTGTTFTGAPTDAFQGYGGTIEHNSFSGTRRAVHFRTYCNGVVASRNWIGHRCGTNDTANAPAPFDIQGVVTNSSVGNVIEANVIETGAYVYGVRLGAYTTDNTVAFNSLFDPTAITLAGVRCDSGSGRNLLIAGYGSSFSGDVFVSEHADVSGFNTIINPHQSRQSMFPQGLRAGNVDMFAGSTAKLHPGSQPTAEVELEAANSSTSPYLNVYLTRAGGARTLAWLVQQQTSGNPGEYIAMMMLGSIRNQILASGLFQIQTANGSRIEIGNTGSTQAIVVVDNAVGFHGATPQTRPSVTGSRGGNAALASLLTALDAMGLITNSTTA